MKEIISLALNKRIMVKSSYDSKSSSVTPILHQKTNKQQIYLHVVLVLRDKLGKKRVLNEMLSPYEK